MPRQKTKTPEIPDREKQSGAAFAYAPIGMILATPTGQIVDANPALLRLLSRSREEVIGKDASDLLLPEYATDLETFFDSLRVGKRDSGIIESQYRHREGRTIWLRVSINVQRDEKQNAIQLIGVVEDVTETRASRDSLLQRAQVESEARDGERHLRILAESLPQMIWTATPDGMLDYLSDQGLRYLGIEEQELYGEKWLGSVHPEDYETAVTSWTQAVVTTQPYEVSYRLKRFDGSWRWHLVRGLPFMGDNGKVTKWHGTCTDIEAQKQAEANLRQQWTTFDTALSYTPDSVYIFDLEGRFTYANQALMKLLGKRASEVIGQPLGAFHHSTGYYEAIQRQLEQVIRTKERLRDHLPFTDAHGETREFEHILVPILGDDGEVRAVAGASRDVTQQRRAEETIQKDRQRWHELLLRAPAAIAIFSGSKHVFEWVNSEFVRLVGRESDGKLLGKSAREALPELLSQGYFEVLDKVYVDGQPQSAHETLVRLGEGADVQEVYVNFVCMPTRNAEGETNGNFIYATDVTDLVRARKQVEESERQFRTLAETIPHLTWMAHPDGNIFWYNQRWYDYTGTTLSEMQGWRWETVQDTEVLPRVKEQWRRSLKSGTSFDMIFPLKGADGNFRDFLTRVEPVRDYNGQVVRWFGTNTDVTEQKRTEEELRRVNRDLEEFTYAASHDLQEPLRMVNIYTQLMMRTLGPTEGTISKYADVVRQNVARMETLIQDLLKFSRAVHAEEGPPRTEADLAAAVTEAVTVLNSRIEESGATIELPSSWPEVFGDTDQLAHVFQNLLSNALKYCKTGEKPEIGISTELTSSHCTIAVKDNGIGFQQQHAENIFGLFKRLHRRDEYAGTGLGLAICKRIVERSGGRIWAEGRPNEGATFYFTLPRVEV